MGQAWTSNVTGFVQHSDVISVPLVAPRVPLATHGGNHRGGGRAILVPTPIQELTHTNLLPSLPGFSSELTNPEPSVTPTKKMLRFLPAWTQQPHGMRGEPGTSPQGRQGFIQVVLVFGQLCHVHLLLSIAMEGGSLRLKINIC